MEFSQDLIKGTFVPVILSLLKERQMYGYEMVKLVNARTNGILEWKEGTLYPILHRLQAQRLITAQWQEAAGSTEQASRMRKYYRITSRGLAELARRSAEWRQLTSAVNAIMMGA